MAFIGAFKSFFDGNCSVYLPAMEEDLLHNMIPVLLSSSDTARVERRVSVEQYWENLMTKNKMWPGLDNIGRALSDFLQLHIQVFDPQTMKRIGEYSAKGLQKNSTEVVGLAYDITLGSHYDAYVPVLLPGLPNRTHISQPSSVLPATVAAATATTIAASSSKNKPVRIERTIWCFYCNSNNDNWKDNGAMVECINLNCEYQYFHFSCLLDNERTMNASIVKELEHPGSAYTCIFCKKREARERMIQDLNEKQNRQEVRNEATQPSNGAGRTQPNKRTPSKEGNGGRKKKAKK